MSNFLTILLISIKTLYASLVFTKDSRIRSFIDGGGGRVVASVDDTPACSADRVEVARGMVEVGVVEVGSGSETNGTVLEVELAAVPSVEVAVELASKRGSVVKYVETNTR